MIALTLIQILQVLLDVIWWIIFVQFILSLLIAFNVINTSNNFIRSLHYGLDRLTEPMYRPIRRVLPNMGGLDLSPMVVLVLIAIGDIILRNLAIGIVSSATV
ncbi:MULTISPECIES: YggT family protein [unclassified Sphingomonas]|uniref:YggT family protein n=1 Tax=Sphingomonas sp. TaxID=28214 RepID=UPI000E1076B1|nr:MULTISPECIES: YggT family protein [unclassified Sphingomonas]AXJ95131.1 YggT family protein [Sphingomonas sp. FARSPH]